MRKEMGEKKIAMPDYHAKAQPMMKKAESGNKIKEARPKIETFGRDDKSRGNGYMRGFRDCK